MNIFSLLSIVAGLASLVFFIIVLIELAKAKGALHCVLGILCGLYTFIWGWINADARGLKKTMIYWTVAIIVQVILNIAVVALGGTPAATTPAL